MSALEVPEEAIEKAAEALKVSEAPFEDGEAWFRAHARAAVEASAPLIVAAAYEQLAATIDYDRYRTRTETGLMSSVDLVREDILGRASVLRGERQAEVIKEG